MQSAPGILFVVATPIGNLQDITLRALKVLGAADAIACEDTRHAGVLLSHHGIRRPLISYFEHNEERRTPELIERLLRGEKIALISDAGTPTISDPGYRLVRAAHEAGVQVVAIPGPSAAIAALSISGLPTNRFAFEGFVPAKAEARRKWLETLKDESRTMVFFESPRRLTGTISDMEQQFGADRRIAIVREITKIHEETILSTLKETAGRIAEGEPRGEIVIVVEGCAESPARGPAPGAGLTVDRLVEAGVGLKRASELVAELTGQSKREVYQAALRRMPPPRTDSEED